MYLYIITHATSHLNKSNNGHFPSDQKCWFQFLVILSGTWNLSRAFPGSSGKEDGFARKNQIFENFLLAISVPFDFLPGMVICLSRNQQFLNFLEIF